MALYWPKQHNKHCFPQRAKKTSAKAWSPLQELKFGQHREPYLLVVWYFSFWNKCLITKSILTWKYSIGHFGALQNLFKKKKLFTFFYVFRNKVIMLIMLIRTMWIRAFWSKSAFFKLKNRNKKEVQCNCLP